MRDGGVERLGVIQFLHFLSFLTQPDRCSFVTLLADDSLLCLAVPLVGALVSSSKACRLAESYQIEREAAGQLLLEIAKHTLQLAMAVVPQSRTSVRASAAAAAGTSSTALKSAVSAPALAVTSFSASSSSGELAVTGGQAGQQELGSASLAGDREEGVSALLWGSCHLSISAARLMLQKADPDSGQAPSANVQLRPSQIEDVKAVQQLLQDLQYSSAEHSSSSSSRSKHQAGCSKGSSAGLGTTYSATNSSTDSCANSTKQEQCRASSEKAGPLSSLERVARRSMARVIQSCCCNNPECVALEGGSELGMVLGGVCGGCRSVAYCSRGCQELDWKEHRRTCMRLRTEKRSS